MRKSILLVMSMVIIGSCRDANNEKQSSTLPGDTARKQQKVINPNEQSLAKTNSGQKATAVDKQQQTSHQVQPGLEQNATTDNDPSENLIKNEPTLRQFMSSLAEKKQVFTVAPGKTVTIKAEKGTELKIAPADLLTTDGKEVTGDITVVINEFPGKLDMLKANSQTVSNGQLLVSGGSYYVELTSDGKPLRLKEGKTFEALFPGLNQDGMEIFYGARDNVGNMNWVKSSENATVKSLAEEQKAWSKDKAAQNDSWYFRTFKLIIKTNALELYAGKASPNGQIKRNRYDINNSVRGWMERQINHAKIGYASYHGGQLDGYYFYTDECEIFLDIEVLSKNSSELTTEELNVLKSELSWYAQQTRERLEQEELNNRMASTARLKQFGWINCDRFYKDTTPPKNFMVNLKYPGESATSATVYMLFKDINSLMNGNYNSASSYSFEKVPGRAEVCLVAFTTFKGKILAAKSDYFNLSEQSNYNLKLKELTLEEWGPFIKSL